MSGVGLGVVLGIVAGLISVALMLPMTFPDKRAALAGSFASRFLIGFFSATVVLPLHPVAAGGVIGLLVSIPDAIITKAYLPILVIGVILGLLCGAAVFLWAS
jgi:hypothetical protein